MSYARYYKPKDASAALGVSPATLRRWSELFASALSPDASPEAAGTRRRYSSDDLALLRYAAKLLADGHQISDVSELLKVAKPEDIEPLPERGPEPEWRPEPPEAAESATESTTGQDMPQEPSMALVPLVQNVQAALTATLQRAAAQERLLADQAERLTRQEREIADQRERMLEQARALEATERQLAGLADRLSALEDREPEEKPVPWWQKLFGTAA